MSELVKRDLNKVELCGSKVWADGVAGVVDARATLKDVELGLQACMELEQKCPWWIGDIVNQAEAIFGEEYHAIESLLAEKVGYSLDTIQRHRRTAQRFALADRQKCEISKHRLVENLPKGERNKLMKRIVNENLTANDIRDILKAKKGSKDKESKHQYMLCKWNVREKEIDMGSLWEMMSDKGNRSFTKDEFEKLGLADMNDTSTVYVILKKPIVTQEDNGPLVEADDHEAEAVVDDKTMDELVEQAIAIIMEQKRAATSTIQRRLGVGYSKASEIMDELETRGIVGPPKKDGGARDILIEAVQEEVIDSF
jgi:Ca2+-binding EF-hand superfamily protein